MEELGQQVHEKVPRTALHRSMPHLQGKAVKKFRQQGFEYSGDVNTELVRYANGR